jgi:plasmid stabilization system protein ParE
VSGYSLHPEAFVDLQDMWEYVAQHNLDAADRVIADTFDAIRNLVLSPHAGHRRPDLTSRPLRFWRVRNHRKYLIAYAPDERPLWVVAVLHGSRDPRLMAAVLRGRE